MTRHEQPLIEVLRRNSLNFHHVVPFDPKNESLCLLDSTEKNAALTPEIVNDTQRYTDYINTTLRSSKAKFAIGGYDEVRGVYSRSRVFDSKPGEEPRRLHLGIDIWGKPNTPVMSPLDGIVHSFAFNNNFGDYGATIILTHNLDGFVLHTLYGHVSLNSLKNLQEGQNVRKGDVIAEFGLPFENGQWPPHLHFQIIVDLGDWKGDYPGVCKISEREQYLSNCPDPDLILQMMRYASVTITA